MPNENLAIGLYSFDIPILYISIKSKIRVIVSDFRFIGDIQFYDTLSLFKSKYVYLKTDITKLLKTQIL